MSIRKTHIATVIALSFLGATSLSSQNPKDFDFETQGNVPKQNFLTGNISEETQAKIKKIKDNICEETQAKIEKIKTICHKWCTSISKKHQAGNNKKDAEKFLKKMDDLKKIASLSPSFLGAAMDFISEKLPLRLEKQYHQVIEPSLKDLTKLSALYSAIVSQHLKVLKKAEELHNSFAKEYGDIITVPITEILMLSQNKNMQRADIPTLINAGKKEIQKNLRRIASLKSEISRQQALQQFMLHRCLCHNHTQDQKSSTEKKQIQEFPNTKESSTPLHSDTRQDQTPKAISSPLDQKISVEKEATVRPSQSPQVVDQKNFHTMPAIKSVSFDFEYNDQITKTKNFMKWFTKINDKTQKIIDERIHLVLAKEFKRADTHKLRGNDTIFEIRIQEAQPALRIYYTIEDNEITLLCGGEKKNQEQDITQATQLAKQIKALKRKAL